MCFAEKTQPAPCRFTRARILSATVIIILLRQKKYSMLLTGCASRNADKFENGAFAAQEFGLKPPF
jgi:hypothetical protein